MIIMTDYRIIFNLEDVPYDLFDTIIAMNQFLKKLDHKTELIGVVQLYNSDDEYELDEF